MSNPVQSVDQEPVFGGARGVKRPLQGSNPTRVPRNQPAFRGVPNTPGTRVRAPTIEAKNRHDRGTNVTIPYSRLVPWDALRDVGRISPGDAVFVSRMNSGGPHYAPTAAPTRVVGVDWLNRKLGNLRPHANSSLSAPLVDTAALVPGYNVLLGAHTRVINPDPVADAAADNWRELSLLRNWALDGVVLSNDEPGVMQGSGKNDAQLFNICVQGLCPVNNGYGASARQPCHAATAERGARAQLTFAAVASRRTATRSRAASTPRSGSVRRRRCTTTTARRPTPSTTSTRCRCSTARSRPCRRCLSGWWPPNDRS